MWTGDGEGTNEQRARIVNVNVLLHQPTELVCQAARTALITSLPVPSGGSGGPDGPSGLGGPTSPGGSGSKTSVECTWESKGISIDVNRCTPRFYGRLLDVKNITSVDSEGYTCKCNSSAAFVYRVKVKGTLSSTPPEPSPHPFPVITSICSSTIILINANNFSALNCS